jgi:L-threonylcarbamoyladenylate synthase
MKPLFWDDFNTIDEVEKIIRQAGVVLAEGDTVLGLLADISAQGFAKLDAIKKRSKRPYLLLVGDQKKVLNLIEKSTHVDCQIENIMNICWPGPVTLILKAKSTVPVGVKAPDGTVAIRIPDHAGLLALLQRFEALYSTSANLAGAPVPNRLEEVDSSIMQAVDGIVLNDDGTNSTMPSTIIDCTGDTIKVIRQGAFPLEKLQAIFPVEFK